MELYEQINDVFVETIKMFDLTIKYLEDSFSCFFNDDGFEENENEINDDVIDKSLIKIEKRCLNIILRERPFATDLRKITGIFKLVDDIERLGDHSEDIAWCIKNIRKSTRNKVETKSLLEMINVSLRMVSDSYQALVKLDELKAINVLKTDDVVDTLYLKVLEELSPLNKTKNNDHVIYMTLIAKYIERIADHASNIAEWAIYIKSGYYKDEVII